jgi:DnaJ-class molecular chaperone
MSRDPYEILGVKRDASQKDIQSAFRKLAKKFHPDLNPGDKKAEERFKDISAANEIVGDEDKRKRFDRGEIDINGAEQAPRNFYREYASADGAGGPYNSGAGFADFGDADDLFSSFFTRRTGKGGFKSKGGNLQFRMEVDFLDAINGTASSVQLPGGPLLEVKIPPGTRHGQTLRLRGKGEVGVGGGPPGDALIEVQVRPHSYFVRDGDDIRLELPISLAEAVAGGRVRVPTPSGAVYMTLKPNSNTGMTLRLKGKGAPKSGGEHGDVYVTLKIVLPETPDAELTEFVRKWSRAAHHDPRRHMEG